MTERVTAARLAAALQQEAERAMSLTDTDRELHRLHSELGRSRRRRAIVIAAAASSAAAALIVVLLLALGGGSGESSHRLTPIEPGPTNASSAPAVTMPADLPTGAFSRQAKGNPFLTIRPTGTAQVQDANGISEMPLTFPAAHQIRFGSGDKHFCLTAGTYRYSFNHNVLRFTKIHDTCTLRPGYLTAGPWHAQ